MTATTTPRPRKMPPKTPRLSPTTFNLEPFMAWWEIEDPNLTREQAIAIAREDLPQLAASYGHFWDPAFSIRWETPANGLQTPLGYLPPGTDVVVAYTTVDRNALKPDRSPRTGPLAARGDLVKENHHD